MLIKQLKRVFVAIASRLHYLFTALIFHPSLGSNQSSWAPFWDWLLICCVIWNVVKVLSPLYDTMATLINIMRR